ncbi:hypothetical protein SAMN05444166_0550 [Singulisphaera sp. GP187]|nr:hypothetical protein SAMN05444166_0550 [Singulisphaera sp. GP187]
MQTRRIIGFACLPSLVIALPLALSGCGGSSQEVGATGEVKPAPGSVELDKEYEQTGKAAKKPQ